MPRLAARRCAGRPSLDCLPGDGPPVARLCGRPSPSLVCSLRSATPRGTLLPLAQRHHGSETSSRWRDAPRRRCVWHGGSDHATDRPGTSSWDTTRLPVRGLECFESLHSVLPPAVSTPTPRFSTARRVRLWCSVEHSRRSARLIASGRWSTGRSSRVPRRRTSWRSSLPSPRSSGPRGWSRSRPSSPTPSGTTSIWHWRHSTTRLHPAAQTRDDREHCSAILTTCHRLRTFALILRSWCWSDRQDVLKIVEGLLLVT